MADTRTEGKMNNLTYKKLYDSYWLDYSRGLHRPYNTPIELFKARYKRLNTILLKHGRA